jgi:hypothetical protein
MKNYILELSLLIAYILIWIVLVLMCFIGDILWIIPMLLWGNIPLFFNRNVV